MGTGEGVGEWVGVWEGEVGSRLMLIVSVARRQRSSLNCRPRTLQ